MPFQRLPSPHLAEVQASLPEGPRVPALEKGSCPHAVPSRPVPLWDLALMVVRGWLPWPGHRDMWCLPCLLGPSAGAARCHAVGTLTQPLESLLPMAMSSDDGATSPT